MDHKVIVINLLAHLETERAEYFNGIVAALDRDPRTEEMSNLVYLVLKSCARDIPIYLPTQEFVELLLRFIHRHYIEISKIIYDPKFVWDELTVKPVTNKFTSLVIERLLEKYKDGDIALEEPEMHCYRWPYKTLDFPYTAEDEAEDLEEFYLPRYAGSQAG